MTVNTSILVNDDIKKVSLISTSSLPADAASILTNDALENINWILASFFVTDASSIHVNDTIDKVSSTSASSLVTDAVFIFMNDAIENIDLTLATSVVTDAANFNLTLPLLPFPHTSLPSIFHCITGIDFTYQALLYHNHQAWIESILHILQLFYFYFHLEYIFLFTYRDPDNPCPFAELTPFIQSAILPYNISSHFILSNNLSNNVSCFCSFLYLTPLTLKSLSLFTQHSPPFFTNSLF